MLSKQACIVFLLLHSTVISTVAQQQVIIKGKKEIIYPINPSAIYSIIDLGPLKNILQGKEIIGMGEATHGTKEFFDLKGKMFVYLVQELNIKVFGIEASYSSCLYLNDFVLYGKGRIDVVMRRLEFWTWQTEEMKQLIEWMRAYNQNKAEESKISFYGFDMQSFNAPLSYLYDYIKSKDIEDAPNFLKVIEPIYNRGSEIYKALSGNNRNLMLDTLERTYEALKIWFAKKELAYNKEGSSKKFQQIKLCIQNFKECVINQKYNTNPSFRDSCMANTILQIRNIENAKMFVWAHNGHIRIQGSQRSFRSTNQTMGYYLKNVFGARYYAIGFLFHQGKFLAVKGHSSLVARIFSKYILSRKYIKLNLIECYMSGSPENSIASTLSKIDKACFFIDLTNIHNELFTTKQIAYSVGAVFMNRRRSLQVFTPIHCYDGLFFVNTTNASHLLSYKNEDTSKHF